jgi:hypothetical protein
MKYFIYLLAIAFSHRALACINITGLYYVADGLYYKFDQTGCETLSKTVCSNKDNCSSHSTQTWQLDGTMNSEFYTNLVRIVPEGISLHFTTFEEVSGIDKNDGALCKSRDYWLTKDGDNNLLVTYRSRCISKVGDRWPFTNGGPFDYTERQSFELWSLIP